MHTLIHTLIHTHAVVISAEMGCTKPKIWPRRGRPEPRRDYVVMPCLCFLRRFPFWQKHTHLSKKLQALQALHAHFLRRWWFYSENKPQTDVTLHAVSYCKCDLPSEKGKTPISSWLFCVFATAKNMDEGGKSELTFTSNMSSLDWT